MSNHKSGGSGAVLGLAAIAAAAGAYYFYGSNAAVQHRRKMKSWVLRAQADVMEKMEQMKGMSKEAYENAVNQVMAKYQKVKSIPPEELAQMSKEMKSHWNRISGHLQEAAGVKNKPARRKAKRK